ncbi:MAG: hypothetical protein LDL41_11195 [Coleofasciculus sp. S288]|nr:hypothetical protein [Coleofasciculus sp. S288]
MKTTQNSNSSSPTPTQPAPTPGGSPKRKSFLLIGGIAVIATSLLASGGYLLYKHLRNNELQILLEQIESAKQEGKFDQCISQAQSFPKDDPKLYESVKVLLGECQHSQAVQLLIKAKELANSGRFKDAITEASQITISSDASLHVQAKELIDEWSNRILLLAEEQYQSGNLDTALDWVKAVPENNPAYQKAQKLLETFQMDWQANEEHYRAAQDALNQGQWNKALTEANKVTTKYWKQKIKPIRDRANDEQHLSAAWSALNNEQWDRALNEASKTTTDFSKQQVKLIRDRANDGKHLSAARTALNNGQWDRALNEASKVTTDFSKRQAKSIRDRANDGKHLSAARIALNNGQLDKAIQEINQVTTDSGKLKAEEIKQEIIAIIGLAAFLEALASQ